MFISTACSNKDVFWNTRVLPSLNITQCITNQQRPVEIKRKLGSRLHNQTRTRFATFATLRRSMDAHIQTINPPARLFNGLNQALVDRLGFVSGDDAPTHYRLVGDNHDFVVCLFQASQRAESLRVDHHI